MRKIRIKKKLYIVVVFIKNQYATQRDEKVWNCFEIISLGSFITVKSKMPTDIIYESPTFGSLHACYTFVQTLKHIQSICTPLFPHTHNVQLFS